MNIYIGSIALCCASYFFINKKYHLTMVSKLVDSYVDFKYYLTSNNTDDKNEEFILINKDTIIKDKFKFTIIANYILWSDNINTDEETEKEQIDEIHKTYSKKFESKKFESAELINHEFEIINISCPELEKINKELFLQVINKFAGYYCDFHNNIPTIEVLNAYEPELNLLNDQSYKIILQNQNYEEFIIS